MAYRLEWSFAGPYGRLQRWSRHGDAAGARAAALAVERTARAHGMRLVLTDDVRGDEAEAMPDAQSLLAWDVGADPLPLDGDANPLLAERRAAERADGFARSLLQLTAAAVRDGVITADTASALQTAAMAATGRPDPRWPRGRPD